ncbi:dihydrodipicolinate synthetase family protein [Aureobasidium pullulans]|nr:dihydrodipicolinate synthetase family protein [Aureobasidium pullulans]
MTAPGFGVYTPLVTYFHDDETLHLEVTSQHALRMAHGGVTGFVLQGSNGEAPHLMHEERKDLVKSIRKTLDSSGYENITLIVGCGAPSVFETLVYIREAKECGANFALLLPPSYWAAAMSSDVLEKFFSAVAAETSLPFLIYNFPAVTAGIDMSSNLIRILATKFPGKIVGAKLTCGNLGKLQRLAYPPLPGAFSVFAGKSDFFLPGLVAGSNGVIAALANLTPKAHVKMLQLYSSGSLKDAVELQTKLSHADWYLSKVGVAGVKAVVAEYFGYGSGKARRPLGVFDIATLSENSKQAFDCVVDIERSL